MTAFSRGQVYCYKLTDFLLMLNAAQLRVTLDKEKNVN